MTVAGVDSSTAMCVTGVACTPGWDDVMGVMEAEEDTERLPASGVEEGGAASEAGVVGCVCG